jgi:electron transport complex protein RnfD
MPPGAPYWVSAVGGAFAIVVVKQAFGGLGFNFMNPALAARAFLLAAWPIHMTAAWVAPRGSENLSGIFSSLDGITAATPLTVLKKFVTPGLLERTHLADGLGSVFFGNTGGCLGETSVLALLIGGAVLLLKKYIDYKIPLAFICTVFLLTWLFNGSGSFFTAEALLVPCFHIFTGGLMLGAFFMATDMVTSPITPLGSLLFGVGCGCITVLIRLIGGYPEGVSYSILLMNITVPLLDKIKLPKIYGSHEATSNE